MAYLALYRKWRPRTFSEVVGQKHISIPLRRAIEQDRLAHAYLFSGPRGTGKTSMAKILAKAVNCEHLEEGNPCNSCEICREINAGASLDVYEIDAASNRGIEEIRALKESVRTLPAACRKKVYIIDEVHMLTKEAFNALLKTLEEPPSRKKSRSPFSPAASATNFTAFPWKTSSSTFSISQKKAACRSQKMPLTSSLSALMAVSEMHFPSLISARLQPKLRRSTLQKSTTFSD